MLSFRIVILLIGDLLSFALALILSLLLRNLALPSEHNMILHFLPFSILFIVWIFGLFLAGMYEKRIMFTSIIDIVYRLFVIQTINIMIAIIFFFLVPSFGITPKTILAIYMIVSLFILIVWRTLLFAHFAMRNKEPTIVIGDRHEVVELVDALSISHFAAVEIKDLLTPKINSLASEIREAVRAYGARFIIADFDDPRVASVLSDTYIFLASGVNFVDAMLLYEDVFGRIPLCVVDDRWAARNISRYRRTIYDFLKRAIDLVAGSVLAIASLIVYPPVILAIKLQDGGAVFYSQVRVGKNNKPIVIYKFRSMREASHSDESNSSLRITPLGRMLRRSRIDELPQLWSVIKGDLSLVGPRPEIPLFAEQYSRFIPHYRLRYLVKPGLSGWAQLYHDAHPHHDIEFYATREKLSYDLYYLRHRSILVDIMIILKTLKTLLSRTGS